MLDRVPVASSRIYVILQRFEGRVIVGCIVGGEPSQLQAINASTSIHGINTILTFPEIP